MANQQFRIPRVAMAVLVLGGACGDDDKDDNDGSSPFGKPSATKPSRTNTGSGTGTNTGSGGTATATTLPDGTSVATVDVSDARISRIAAAFCAQAFECNPEEAAEYYGTETKCKADVVSYWSEYVQTYGKTCSDAALDFYECYSSVSCGEEDACEALAAKANSACE